MHNQALPCCLAISMFAFAVVGAMCWDRLFMSLWTRDYFAGVYAVRLGKARWVAIQRTPSGWVVHCPDQPVPVGCFDDWYSALVSARAKGQSFPSFADLRVAHPSAKSIAALHAY